jgi:hypothetical protein
MLDYLLAHKEPTKRTLIVSSYAPGRRAPLRKGWKYVRQNWSSLLHWAMHHYLCWNKDENEVASQTSLGARSLQIPSSLASSARSSSLTDAHVSTEVRFRFCKRDNRPQLVTASNSHGMSCDALRTRHVCPNGQVESLQPKLRYDVVAARLASLD